MYDESLWLAGRVNTLLKYIASERLPKLHNRLVLPQRLTADLDEHLQAVTEDRLQRFTHDDGTTSWSFLLWMFGHLSML